MSALERMLKFRRSEMMAGREPGVCFVAQGDTRELAAKVLDMLAYGPSTEENHQLMLRMSRHMFAGGDPFVLNGLKIFGMTIQVEGSAQVAA